MGKKTSANKTAKRPPVRSPKKESASEGNPKKLLIVESPAKVKTIQKFLGGEFAIMASKGHVRDLKKTGERKMGIDVQNHFQADYGEILSKKKTIEALRRAACSAVAVP